MTFGQIYCIFFFYVYYPTVPKTERVHRLFQHYDFHVFKVPFTLLNVLNCPVRKTATTVCKYTFLHHFYTLRILLNVPVYFLKVILP